MTQLPDKYVKGGLMMLCNPKNAVISKQTKKPTFDDENETFELNLQFQSQQIRLNLIPVM